MVEQWKVTLSLLPEDQPRRVYVYLPDSYSEEPKRRYPVLYMFDGHNVFFDQDATFGKSWGMNEYMKKSKRELLIVAVECNQRGNCRLQEYSPVNFENAGLGKIRGKGKAYMDYLVNTLKPEIDRRYRTLPDRDNTSLAGSSMGGLMALYGVTAYNRVFRRAACLSPSLWVSPDKLLELIGKTRVRNDTCVFMNYGSKEMGNHGENALALVSMMQLLMAKKVNVTLRVVPGGTHSEGTWEKEIPIFMDCLDL